jgi:hypothetical protein
MVVLVTSLIDLFINRLLFRAGPDVLKHVMPSNSLFFALVGRISITVEQALLFVILASVAALLIHESRQLLRFIGSSVLVLVVCSALLYVPLPSEQAWAASLLLVLIVAATLLGLAYVRIEEDRSLPAKPRLAHAAFLICVVLSFIFPLYYQTYLLAGAAGLGSLPFPLDAYLAGIFSVMGSMILVFGYALVAAAPGFALRYRDFAKAAILPTVLVVPTFYEMMRSFFVIQILSLVVAMSTDFVLSHTLLEAMVLLLWFFLTAVFILFLKGQYSNNRMPKQEAIGLILIMSMTYLFNYPYYLMLGVTGVMLLCYPLAGNKTTGTQNSRSDQLR